MKWAGEWKRSAWWLQKINNKETGSVLSDCLPATVEKRNNNFINKHHQRDRYLTSELWVTTHVITEDVVPNLEGTFRHCEMEKNCTNGNEGKKRGCVNNAFTSTYLWTSKRGTHCRAIHQVTLMQNTTGQKYFNVVRRKNSKSTNIGGSVSTVRKGLIDPSSLYQTAPAIAATVTVKTANTAPKNFGWGFETKLSLKNKRMTSKRFAVAMENAVLSAILNIVWRTACDTFALRWTIDRGITTNIRRE